MIIIFFALWLLFNGRFTADNGMLQIIVVGAALSFFVNFIVYRYLGLTVKKELSFWKKTPLLLLYAVVLVKEIIISALRMAVIITKKSKDITPAIVRVKIPLETDFSRFILANSITLTPGTITADFEGELFTIHCIDISLADGIEDCLFVKILRKAEKI